MWTGIRDLLKHLSLVQQFMLASLVILLAGMIGIGAWVGRQIEAGVVHGTATTAALYVDSFVAPHLTELAQDSSISPGHMAMLDNLLRNTPIGQQVVAFKVWGTDGRVLYSTDLSIVGRTFPVHDRLTRAWRGEVTGRVSQLEEEENVAERRISSRLLEIYTPVYDSGTNRIIAVAEFYQRVESLQADIGNAQRWSWLAVTAAMLVIYLLLAGFVRRASEIIARQQNRLSDQVTLLTGLLAQNKELSERVRGAAARVATLNERFLRRTSAELHDGPAQDLGLALLRLDHAMARSENCALLNQNGHQCNDDLVAVQSSLQHALQEMRTISAGLGMPELRDLTLLESLTRAVRAHERRTGTKVARTLDGIPDQVSLPVKVTLYRLVQEALSNAYRHAGGVGQQVFASFQSDELIVQVVDQGSGFEVHQMKDEDRHLGLVGMRERMESLGGRFQVLSEPGRGTRVIARLHLQMTEGEYGR